MKTTIIIYMISIVTFLLSIEFKSYILAMAFFASFFIGFIKMGIDAWRNFLTLPVNYLRSLPINNLWNIDQEMKLDLIEINWRIEQQKQFQKHLNDYSYIPIYPHINMDASGF